MWWSHSEDKLMTMILKWLQVWVVWKDCCFLIFRAQSPEPFFFRNHAFPNSRSESPSVSQSGQSVGGISTSHLALVQGTQAMGWLRSKPECSWIHASPKEYKTQIQLFNGSLLCSSLLFRKFLPCSLKQTSLTHQGVPRWIWGDLKQSHWAYHMKQ